MIHVVVATVEPHGNAFERRGVFKSRTCPNVSRVNKQILQVIKPDLGQSSLITSGPDCVNPP